jgi:hypothetical protein
LLQTDEGLISIRERIALAFPWARPNNIGSIRLVGLLRVRIGPPSIELDRFELRYTARWGGTVNMGIQ